MHTHTDRARYVFGWGWGLPALLVVSLSVTWMALGCQSNPLTSAHTPLQKAYALYGEFVIVEEQAAQLKSTPNTPVALKRALQLADARAQPSANALLQATLDYTAASRELAQGTGTPEKLQITQTHLNQWIAQTETDITVLLHAVEGK
jgi:hypothetical protein